MERHLGRAALGGFLAGLAGAACMGVVAVLGAAIAGKGWYFPLELAGGLATGSTARFDAGLQWGVAAVGAILHVALAAGWGALFGILVGYFVGSLVSSEGIWMGTFFGIIVWVIDLFTLMPRVDPAAARAIPLWFGALAHLGYGAVLGVTFPRFSRAQPISGSPSPARR
jgi:hypothetical protein